MKSNLYKKDLITTKYAGTLSGYTSRYLRRLARSGEIEGVQVGRVWMIKRGSLVRFLDTQTKHKKELSLKRSRVHAEEYSKSQAENLLAEPVGVSSVPIVPVEKSASSPKVAVRNIPFHTNPFVLSAAVALLVVGSLATQVVSFPQFTEMTKQTAAVASTPILSVGEQIALGTYETINNLFTSANRGLAFLFTPAPTIVSLDVGTPKPASTTAISFPARNLSMESQTPVQNIVQNATSYPTYTTVVQGVSKDFVSQSLASLRSDLLATISGQVQPVRTQTATNASTIQYVNMIQKLDSLTVTNGTFTGGIFDSG
ncbi:MAG: helix-turn-helix domain-containing protein, partial [Patescibacteria group bacterium]|nr:helix-turn-helix domain-containing protein [Patescibacteria group bacterium]